MVSSPATAASWPRRSRVSRPTNEQPGVSRGGGVVVESFEPAPFVLSGGRLPIVGVGGILDPDDASRLFDAGAALVQLYTGFIYRGPALVRRIAATAAARP